MANYVQILDCSSHNESRYLCRAVNRESEEMLLVVPHDTHQVNIWCVDQLDASEPKPNMTISLVPEGQRVTAFDMAGCQLAVGSANGALVVHTITNGDTSKNIFAEALPPEAPHRHVQAVQFGPIADDRGGQQRRARVVAASWVDGHVRVFDVDSSVCMMEFFHHGLPNGGYGLYLGQQPVIIL